MRINLIITFILSFLSTKAQDTILPNYPGLILWLRADSVYMNNDSTIYKWKDLSASDFNIIQDTSEYQPIFQDSIINNKPAIKFNGNNYLYGGNICNITDSGITIFIVGKSYSDDGTFIAKSLAGSQSKRYAITIYNGLLYFLFHGNTETNITYTTQYDTFNIITAKTDIQATQNKLYLNGLVVDSININVSDMNSNYDFLIGAYNNNQGTTPPYPSLYLNGYIAEIIIYNRPLSFIERFQVENYLCYRYFPQSYHPPLAIVNLGNDIIIPYGFKDTIIDAGPNFISYNWNTGDTTQSITVNQSGIYYVTCIDSLGFQSSDTIAVYYPTFNQIADSTICQYDTLIWNSGLTDSLYTIIWQDNDTTPIKNIYSSGQYYFKVIDTNGCYALSDTISIAIDSFPSSQLFLNEDTTLCIGTNLYAENTEATFFLWSTGDTTNHITIQDSGTYYLTAHNQRQCIAHDTVAVSIAGIAPVVDFSIYGVCQYDTILFENNSYAPDSSNFSSFLWQIDTLATSHSQDTSYMFQDSGTYKIVLTANTETGCSNSIDKYIHIWHLPIIDLSISPFCSETPTIIHPQVNTLGIPATYQWFLDSNVISTADTSSIMLNIPQYGNYNLTLQVTDSNNCKNNYSSTIEVKPSPQADFSFSGKCEHQPITFINQTTTLWYNPLIFNKWYFGDGDSSLSSNTTHIFSDTGNYTITLYTQAVNGCSSHTSKHIYINPIPQINFTDTILCANTRYTLSPNITNTSVAFYQWQIDSTSYSNSSALSIIFPDSGTHQLLLTATTDSACSSYYQTQLMILPQPQASFNINSAYIPQGFSIYANAIDTSYSYYFWRLYSDFSVIDNDSTCGASYYFSPVYGNNNMLLLIVQDSNGCYDTSFTQFHTYNYHQIRVSVIQARYSLQNNYLNIYALLKNEGEAPTTGFYVICKMQGIGQFSSTFDTVIYPNEEIWYKFPTSFYAPTPPQSICLWTENHNIEGFANPKVICLSPATTSLQVLNIYPIPAHSYIYADINMPYSSGDIIVYLTNTLGQNSKTQIFKNLQKGVNTLKINLQDIRKGTYLLNIISGSYLYKQKIIVE